MIRWFSIASVTFLLSAPTPAAEPKDLAELFPVGTLAYAEIGAPAGTSDAIAEFVKGTLLADSLGFGHDRRDKLVPPASVGGLKKAGEWSLFTSPEMLAELKRLRGIAAAVTGFDAKTGRPTLAVAVVLGDSHAAGWLVRQYLLTAENIRRVGKVEGIPVYQNRGLTGVAVDEDGKPEPNEDPTPAQGEAEPTYLYAPGLFVVGSNVAAVKDVYRRFAGLEKGASFAASIHLKPHAEARKNPGLFFCADVAGFEVRLIAAKKVSQADWLKSPAIAYVRFLLNPKLVESFAGSWQLQPDGWTFTARAELRPGGACPLLALLSGGVTDVDGRHGSPGDSPGAFTVAFPEKGKRAKAILDAADAVGQALGHVGALPSDLAAEADKGDFKLSAEWLPLVRSATFVLPQIPTDAKAKPARPLVIFTLEDEPAAKGWLGVVPKLSQLLSGAAKAPEPASETIQNVKVWGLVHSPGDSSTAIHYAIAGDRLIVSRDRDAVAKAAASMVNPRPKTEGESAAMGTVAFSKLWELLPPAMGAGAARGNPDTRQLPVDIEEAPRLKSPMPDTPDPAVLAKLVREKSLAAMPPVTLQAKGSGQTLSVRIGQRELKKPLATWLETLWRRMETVPADDQLKNLRDYSFPKGTS